MKDRDYLRVKGWKKILQANGPKKHTGIALLISEKKDFKPKLIKNDGKIYYMFIKGKK